MTKEKEFYWVQKRGEKRVPFKLHLKMTGKNAQGGEFEEEVVTENISRRGALVRCKEELKAGATVWLTAYEQVAALATVCSIAPHDEQNGYFRVGLKFEQVLGNWLLK
ncbi:MAG: PilZ domain-containing protein [Acidobacteria bacterium]|nr:PilZ domain-containing protein [Acidobacteriota bacterium]